MAVAITYSSAEIGIDAPLVTVEADVSPGLPQVLIVGLPETAVRESKDRVRAAIISSGYKFPDQRVTVNLAPADLPKTSGRYDLAIALAILAAAGDISAEKLSRYEFLGELSLTGELRQVRGVLPAALKDSAQRRVMIVPAKNGYEAALSESSLLRVSHSLIDTLNYFANDIPLPGPPDIVEPPDDLSRQPMLTLADVTGQHAAKRALAIAAAGGHNLLMMGPPGTGKTMLASRLPALIPEMSLQEALEVASIFSVSRLDFSTHNWRVRPFRSPHHTASAAAMVGGSNPPRPGEISLAHNGVLFLDELPEFSRHVLEVLREPLESGEIWISRAAHQVKYPARFQLLAAMNPCPCGYYGDEQNTCECTADRIQRYRARVSGPLLDRIDLHVEVSALPPGTLAEAARDERQRADTDAQQALEFARVSKARNAMLARQGTLNAHLDGAALRTHCHLSDSDLDLLDASVARLGISARGYFKILKTARTIADLADEIDIKTNHLLEALGYRNLSSPGQSGLR